MLKKIHQSSHIQDFRYTKMVYSCYYEWEKLQLAIWRNKSRLLNKRANRELVKPLHHCRPGSHRLHWLDQPEIYPLTLFEHKKQPFMSDFIADLKSVASLSSSFQYFPIQIDRSCSCMSKIAAPRRCKCGCRVNRLSLKGTLVVWTKFMVLLCPRQKSCVKISQNFIGGNTSDG